MNSIYNDTAIDVFNRYFYAQIEEEKEADEFACALLMPEDEFINIAKQNYNRHTKMYNITNISKHFQVSISAIKSRGEWIGLFEKDNIDE
jgi:Zn-dependent peptidase ImmA (M78 family)